MNEIIIPGKINDAGEVKISGDLEYLDFLRRNKGKNVRIKINVFTGKNTVLNKWYFENIIIPKMKAGFIGTGCQFNDKETMQFVFDNCPFYEEGIEDTARWHMVIEWCKQYAAENLNVVIRDLK
jgi:hypothetical protein